MGKLVTGALLIVSVASIAYAQPKVVASTRAVKITTDIFALPPPAALAALSLGYRSALADVLYASTLISYGAHGEEHRRFEFVGQYLDSIVELDPRFCQTYRYVDTFLTYQAVGSPGPEEVRHARRLLEKGLEMCPHDGKLFMSAGQFMAFIGPQFLTDEAEKKDLVASGARTLARAAELETDNHNVQWQSYAAAGILTREGKREAAIDFLERVYVVTDDEELKANVAAQLRGLREEKGLEERKKQAKAFNEAWQHDMPFVSRSGVLVLGPRYDPSGCSGRVDAASCSNSWAGWAKTLRKLGP